MTESEFNGRRVNFIKLEAFGFLKSGEAYTYRTDIADGEMNLTVSVSSDGKLKTSVTDSETGDEYTLYLNDKAQGEFVGTVREAVDTVTSEIIAECFDTVMFSEDLSGAVSAYAREKYSSELEFLWKKTPDAAILRRSDSSKWYAVFMKISKRKLGFNTDELVEVLDLHAVPDEIEKYVDGEKYFPGYHMNKKYWYTVCLDGSVTAEEIFEKLDRSYDLAKK